jgi:hypothetical protein
MKYKTMYKAGVSKSGQLATGLWSRRTLKA